MAYVPVNISKHSSPNISQKQRKGYDLNGAEVFTKAEKALHDLGHISCPFCKLVLRNPQQLLECGCRYCEPCLNILFTSSNPKCVEDNEPFTKDDVKTDKGCLREIKSLTVKCPGSKSGCMWTGGFEGYEDHYDECAFVTYTCECGAIVSRREQVSHNAVCPNKIGGSLDSGFGSMISCDFPLCTYTGSKEAINEHCLVHIHELSTLLISLQENMKHLQKDYSKLRAQEMALESEVKDYNRQISQLKQEVLVIPALQTDLKKLQTELKEVKRIESDSAHDYKQLHTDIPFIDLEPRISRLEIEMDQLKPLARETKSEIGIARSQLAGYIDSVQTMQESITRHSVTMEEIKLRQDILDVKTTHGTFIWKIPEITRRFRDAQDKRTISLYSPPFHSSPHGYRACIRAYLNGDGSGKGTHISVFFVVMKSEHDNLLKWPFERPVTFELINQENKSQSIMETFMPEKKSASFQKPKSEMNVASGFPKFASHSVLSQHQYTRGDAVFIKCKIDTAGLNYD